MKTVCSGGAGEVLTGGRAVTLVLCAICASLKGCNEVLPHTDCKRSSRKLGANEVGKKNCASSRG